jgi:glutaredoxin
MAARTQSEAFGRLSHRWTVWLLSALLALSACKKEAPVEQKAVAKEPKGASLPPLSFKGDSKGLLLTWVDAQGDFHVATKIEDVPEQHNEQVRVVLQGNDQGTGDTVYVANLKKKRGDGTFPVKTMARSTWDELGAKLRKTRMEALAPSALPAPSFAPSSSEPAAAKDPGGKSAAASNLSAIVYGADWCKPCHAAEDYLKKRGVRVVKKDVDESDAARAEMATKLQRVGRAGSPIPIIDLMGQIMVGYNPQVLDRAIARAQAGKKQ